MLFGRRQNDSEAYAVRNHLLHWFYSKLILSSEQLPLQSHFGIWKRRGLYVQNFPLSVILLKEDLVFGESTLFVVLFCVCLCHLPQIQILRLFQSSGMRSLLEPTGNRSRINTCSTCLPKSRAMRCNWKPPSVESGRLLQRRNSILVTVSERAVLFWGRDHHKQV